MNKRKMITFAANMQNEGHKPVPLVTFIIAYYELPVEMLCQCLDSILALSLSPAEREIIVVDDGSRESPKPLLGDYAGKMVYARKNHAGLSEARNYGISQAQGEYLQFVDADDLLQKAAYEHCIDIVRRSRPDMVMFDFARSVSASRSYADAPLQSGSNFMLTSNIRGTACGYLFRKSILGNLRFTPGIYHEDEEFTPLLLTRARTLCVTNAQAYLYCQRPSSIITSSSQRNKLKRLADAHAVIIRLNDIARQLPQDESTALKRRVAQLTMDYLYNVIRQTRSLSYLKRQKELLHRQGLFPLPDRKYTSKYVWFSRFINSRLGTAVLTCVIPKLNKER